jgi:hypothetical protein
VMALKYQGDIKMNESENLESIVACLFLYIKTTDVTTLLERRRLIEQAAQENDIPKRFAEDFRYSQEVREAVSRIGNEDKARLLSLVK